MQVERVMLCHAGLRHHWLLFFLFCIAAQIYAWLYQVSVSNKFTLFVTKLFFCPLDLYLDTTRQANFQSIWTTISCYCNCNYSWKRNGCHTACLCFNSAFLFVYVLVTRASCVCPPHVCFQRGQPVKKIFCSLTSHQTVKLGSAIKYKSRFDYSAGFVARMHVWPAQLPKPSNQQGSSITTHRVSVTSFSVLY